MRNYFSTNFLWTALHMSRIVGDLETAEGSVPRFDMAHRSYAASSVIASATFLEAAVSELFQDAQDGHGVRDDGYLAPLREDAVATMATVWTRARSRTSAQTAVCAPPHHADHAAIEHRANGVGQDEHREHRLAARRDSEMTSA